VGSREDAVEHVDDTFEYFLDLYQSTTGRSIWALRQMLEIARAYGATEVVRYIEEAIEANLEARNMEGRWERDRQVDEMARVEAHEIRPELDKVVGAIHTQLESIGKAFRERPRGETADELREQLFPEGAGGYTNRPFEDKLSGVRFLLEQFDGDCRDEVETLGLGPSVERLREVADEFYEALSSDDGPDPVSWDEVREARQEGQEAVMRVIAKVLGTFASASDAEARRDCWPRSGSRTSGSASFIAISAGSKMSTRIPVRKRAKSNGRPTAKRVPKMKPKTRA
jgi:hypothetical protein